MLTQRCNSTTMPTIPNKCDSAGRKAEQFMPPRPWLPGDDCRMVDAAGLMGRPIAANNAALKRRRFQFRLQTNIDVMRFWP
jgi:hypothetical protein